jgi:hypothetical protein
MSKTSSKGLPTPISRSPTSSSMSLSCRPIARTCVRRLIARSPLLGAWSHRFGGLGSLRRVSTLDSCCGNG